MRRLTAAWERARCHPQAFDAAAAVVLAALAVCEIFATDVDGEPAAVVPAALLMTLPLAWRRTAPLPVTALVMFALAAEPVLIDASQKPQTPIIALLLAMYSVAAHAQRRQAIAGLVLGVAAILVAEAGDFIVMGPVFALAWSAGRLLRARERDARKLAELAEALDRERVEEARLAVAEERARIARDLHDVVAHAMSSIVLEAGAERVNLHDGQPSTRDALRSIERTGREAMVEMRRLVGLLRSEHEAPALVPHPGLAHLDALAEHVTRAGVPVDMRVVGEPVELAPGLDISVYRIIQEALTNVMKHAGPARATVAVSYGRRVIDIEVSDDGRGGSPNGGGYGLTGLRERVALFGGELHAGAGEGGGFVVRAHLPIEEGRR
ncbi:MAG: sensor histidine kinase [Chloroflexota bacterium]|nr:sensor histidine kinase [Chloroflexota bacterium]